MLPMLQHRAEICLADSADGLSSPFQRVQVQSKGSTFDFYTAHQALVAWVYCSLDSPNFKTSGQDDDEEYTRGNHHRMMWELPGREVGLANFTSRSLQSLYYRARVVAKLWAEENSLQGKDSILKYAIL
ncbi:hypothetical protein BJ878DRAFT_476047 [Calycina marina]|uniref:Uncharacterized protein n=1 Tax=Calycina marina TaxID=1763456 RepID=A0A9P7ZBB9_9HELO|nr:hypothetical protein BJ878DRAFT_476047 [Calycina marina]